MLALVSSSGQAPLNEVNKIIVLQRLDLFPNRLWKWQRKEVADILTHAFWFHDESAFHRMIRAAQMLDYHIEVNGFITGDGVL